MHRESQRWHILEPHHPCVVDRNWVFGKTPLSKNAAGIVAAGEENGFRPYVHQLIFAERLIQFCRNADCNLVYRCAFVYQIRDNALFRFSDPFHVDVLASLAFCFSLQFFLSFA